jgi:hypothetical protein
MTCDFDSPSSNRCCCLWCRPSPPSLLAPNADLYAPIAAGGIFGTATGKKLKSRQSLLAGYDSSKVYHASVGALYKSNLVVNHSFESARFQPLHL